MVEGTEKTKHECDGLEDLLKVATKSQEKLLRKELPQLSEEMGKQRHKIASELKQCKGKQQAKK